jgi:prefoldin subunit 5
MSDRRRPRGALLGKRLPATGLLVSALAFTPGCIVQKISDNLELANQQMVAINQSIARVEGEIETLRTVQLAELDQRLVLLESLSGSLSSVDNDLDTVKVSLHRLDEHLASLRRTLQNIDSTIPFLKLTSDEEEITTPPPLDPPPGQPTPQDQPAQPSK